MKLYVGARRRVFVAEAGAVDYVLCADGAAGESARVAFAILADHLGDRERALEARGHFERTFSARLRASNTDGIILNTDPLPIPAKTNRTMKPMT